MKRVAFDLDRLVIPSYRAKTTAGDHELRGFFATRKISQTLISEVCGINHSYLSQMLRGIMIMQPKVEEKLNNLKREVLEWESVNGRMFNTPPQRKAIKRCGQ